MTSNMEKVDQPASTWREISESASVTSSENVSRKAQPIVNEKEIQGDDIESAQHRTTATGWAPGVKNRFPWLGFGCLITILTCIALCIVVLVTSNEKSEEQWPAYEGWSFINNKWKARTQLKPSVALATLNTISNLALGIAIGNGVAIAWWRRAMQGATVHQLHTSWSFSTSTLDLLTAGKKFNLIALAALTTKIALVDNILLQRAAGTQTGIYSLENSKVTLPIVSELPAGWAGGYNDTDKTAYPSFGLSNVLSEYTLYSDKISLDGISFMDWSSFTTQCYGECFFTAPGFGFNATCTDAVPQPRLQVSAQSLANKVVNGSDFWLWDASAANTSVDNVLASHIEYRAANDPIDWLLADGTIINKTFPQASIVINTKWATLTATGDDINSVTATTCDAVVTYRQCVLTPAHIDYRLSMADTRNPPSWITPTKVNSVSGGSEVVDNNIQMIMPVSVFADAQFAADHQVSGATITGPAYSPWSDTFAGNIGALASAFSSLFQTYVSLQYVNGTGFIPNASTLNGGGILQSWWTTMSSQQLSPDTCVMPILDPMGYIISSINTIMLRNSIYAAFTGTPSTVNSNSGTTGMTPDPSKVVTIGGVEQDSSTVYFVSDYGFLAAACSTMFFCVLCVLPSYWGFWELGRKVTLGPMEIASAFQAPVLQHDLEQEGQAGPSGADGQVIRGGGEVKTLLKVVGDRKVAYGVLNDGKLAVGGVGDVKPLRHS